MTRINRQWPERSRQSERTRRAGGVLIAALFVALLAPHATHGDDRAPNTESTHGENPRVHALAPATPQQLQELFKYTGEPLPLVSAHRGGAQQGLPENCLATFENTVRHTFAALEIDPRSTKDGAIVLHHDARLERTTTGTGRVADHTLDELRALRLKDPSGAVADHRIPTLDEALQWARGKAILVLDQKDVPLAVRVKKIEEHHAESYAMLIVYSFADVQACYALNPNITMEVMIPTRAQFARFEQLGVPWRNVVAFVGHVAQPDREACDLIHSRGAMTIVGTSGTLDRRFLDGDTSDLRTLEPAYRTLLREGVDILETDIPAPLAPILFDGVRPPPSKAQFFH